MRYKNAYAYIFLLTTFISLRSTSNQEKETASMTYTFAHVIHDLQLKKTLSQTRLLILPSVIGLTLYFNKEHIIRNATESPIPVLAASFFLCNYMIDIYSRYKKINRTVDFFIFAQQISMYMLCIVTIKNTMLDRQKTTYKNFNEEEFYSLISTQTGYSFQHLEQITLALMNSCAQHITTVCSDINTTDLSEQVYLLCKDKITIQQLLILTKNDLCLHKALSTFLSNPEEEYSKLLNFLCSRLKKQIHYFT